MPTAFLRSKIDERAALTDLVEGIYEKCSNESRDPNPEERAKLDEYGTRIKALDGTIVEMRTAEEANSRFLDTAARVEDRAERDESRRTAKVKETAVEFRTAGEAFIQSDQFKEYRGRGTMEPVDFDDFLGLEQRAAIVGPITSALLDLPPVRVDGPAGPFQQTPFLSLINREQVSGGAVSYVTWDPNPATGAAVVVETDLKPEAQLVPTEHPLNLQTYAFWKAITRQALEDYPRIRSIVENSLRRGLAQTLEGAAVATLAGVAAPGAGSATNVAGIRAAIAELQGAGYVPTAVAINPADAALLDVEVMGGTLLGPSSPPNYWGLRVVPVAGIAAGTAYVGDWGQAVTWFDRSTASVYMSDSHADYFIRNLFVILAEQRSVFALTEPAAAVAVTVAADAPAALTATAAK